MSFTSTTVQQRSTTPNGSQSFKMNSPSYHFQQPQRGNSSGQSPSQQPSTPVTPVAQQQFPAMPQSAFTGQGFQQFPLQQQFSPQQQQQFAAWAYQAQQMMFQQQQLGFQQPGTLPSPAAYLTPQQLQALQTQFLQQQHLLNQMPQPPQPPYARDNNGSRTSLGSSNEGGRQRTNSNKSSAGRNRANCGSAAGSPTQVQPPHPFPNGQRPRVSSTSSSQKGSLPRSATPPVSVSRSATPPVTSPPTGTAKVNKPSPLSQGSYAQVAAGKPSSKPSASPPAKVAPPRAPQNPAPTPAMVKSGGLKGRLTRALSRSGMENGADDNGDSSRRKPGAQRQPIPARASAESSGPRSPSHAQTPSTSTTSSVPSPVAYAPTEGSIHSTETETAATKPKKKSLFNSRFNRSTDNMSLSSTVSSASVMIRKLGSVGKLVRRNSLAGISSVFGGKKTKDDKEDEDTNKKNKKPKGKEVVPSVAPALSPPEPLGEDMVGLSPAAKLARQHTLRSRAAEAARVKERERIDEETARGSTETPPSWEKSTTNRRKESPMTWSDDDDDSEEEGTFDGHGYHPSQPPQVSDWAGLDDSGEDDDEDYAFAAPGEDDTVRVSDRREDFEDEPWAIGLRRSVERTRIPVKGILKRELSFQYAQTYDQQTFIDPPQAPFTRVRSNSNDSAPPMGAEPGPLARIPSPDPDHIDGLHRSNSTSTSDHHSHHARKPSTSSTNSDFLPAINFDSSDSTSALASTLKDRPFSVVPNKDRPLSGSSATFYANADFNASAPALATSASDSRQAKANGPPLGLRSATAPLTQSRKLTFAANLSVYHTFSPAAYDRRSEPATCNRLTPALAQRIKEELNSYKMEEMEVHQASRMHTHFFV